MKKARRTKRSLCIVLALAMVLCSMSFAFADSQYVIIKDDTLAKIAKKYGTTYHALAEYNNIKNPHFIREGQILKIPSSDAPSTPVPSPAPAPVTPTPAEPVPESKVDTPYDSFVEAIDMDFAYDVAVELSENPEYWSSPIGSRNAGSDAEHNAADYLASVMKDIGLTDIEKVPVKVDKWQFNGASLDIEGEDRDYKLSSYATAATPKDGLVGEIIYLGEGTMYDYEDVDVEGKIVLIDIDQRANWWITHPMLEAMEQGAAAIMAANVGGFSQVSGDALNNNDICGPIGIPCVSISVNDSKHIQSLLEKGPVAATLKVDNIVEPGGTSYNVMGKIKGKSSDEQILFSSHYDMYFKGFQDNSCAVALELAVAKSMIDSDYQPERDIIFVINGAEEWGASGTQFDWSTGAWRMINEAHPEWVGKTLALFNFELPAYEFSDTTSTYSPTELFSFIKDFTNNGMSPQPKGIFSKGVVTEGYHNYTYSDDFSYLAAGVPSMVNGFLLKDNEPGDVWDFYYDYYHTDFDTKDTYNEDVLRFNIAYYGSMAIEMDRTPVLALDFTDQYERVAAAFDETFASAEGVDVAAYKAALENYKAAATASYAQALALNEKYWSLVKSGADEKALAAIWEEAVALNKANLQIFKANQDALLYLMYERPIVAHEAPAENIDLMRTCIELLEKGDVVTAVDEYAWQINGVLEWYNYYFSPKVIDINDEMLFNLSGKTSLFWGTGKSYTPADVEEATRSLMERYLLIDAAGEGADISQYTQGLEKEIAIYEKAIAAQQVIYKSKVADEIKSLNALAEQIKSTLK